MVVPLRACFFFSPVLYNCKLLSRNLAIRSTHREMAILVRESLSTNSDYGTRSMPDSLPVIGGDGTLSYSRNSYYQLLAVYGITGKINDIIMEKLDIETLSSTSNTIRLADLGCAVGPNTFTTMQDAIEVIKKKYQSQCLASKILEFQVFFSDQALNDFNTLFTSLPQEREYFAAGVPGSFHDRLFPNSSIHFVYTSYALHWLSKSPEELQDKNSLAWNKGRVHYVNAPNEVVDAYASQFAKDVENFLNARAKELVVGGMMIIIMPGIPNGMPYSQLATGIMYDLMASCFLDMAKEGLISEAQVDSFNLPIYAASPEEMAGLVERNGYFTIETIELTNPTSLLKFPIDMEKWVMHVRAAMDGMFNKHFDSAILDEMFNRLIKKLIESADQVESSYMKGVQLFAVLKRK